MISDGYDGWYADKLWQLMPAVYRTLDPTAAGRDDGPLRELLERIGIQAAEVRRSIDRLWADQSIETCDDWVIPYIAELLATRLVSCMDAPAQRLDVANTIYYRRRAGTVGLLEELAAKVALRDARIVEFFRRLGRTRHLFDPPIGPVTGRDPAVPPGPAEVEGLIGAFSRTPAGGFADLRNAYAAANAQGPFDEFAHTADFRRGRQRIGWHDIPRLGVFVWWLHSYPLTDVTPVERAGCPGQFTLDASGREVPLFAAEARTETSFGDHWVSPDEWTLPVPIRASLWSVAASALYPTSLHVGLGAGPDPDILDPATLDIWPEAGRFRFLGAPPPGPLGVSYHFGQAGPVGAAGFDPRILPERIDLPGAAVGVVHGVDLDAAISGVAAQATLAFGDSTTFPGPAADLNVAATGSVALVAADGQRPLLRWTSGGATWRITGGAGASLVLQGLYLQNADIVLAGEFDSVRLRLCTFDPGTSGAGLTPPQLFDTAIDGLDLAPARILVEGEIASLVIERCICGPIRTTGAGAIEQLTISDSIVQAIACRDTGASGRIYDVADLAARVEFGTDPAAVQVRAALSSADATALGAYIPGSAPSATLAAALTTAVAGLDPDAMAAAFPLALGDLALGLSSGEASLSRTTVLGPTYTHRLSTSECILDDVAAVEDPQAGCVRFSTYAQGSTLHSPYRSCFTAPVAAILTTRLFGRPDYPRVRLDADAAILGPVPAPGAPPPSIVAGAQDGLEPGAFCSEGVAAKRRGLAQKYEEFMPVNLTPVWIDAD